MIKRVLKDIWLRLLFGHKRNSEAYIKYLKDLGMKIGSNTVIYDPVNTLIDETRPWLISIGENVKITYGSIILTHGYDWSVLKGVYGEVLGSSGGCQSVTMCSLECIPQF